MTFTITSGGTKKTNFMKVYLRNIKHAWKIYKDGRWASNKSIYVWILKYTSKYIKYKLKL